MTRLQFERLLKEESDLQEKVEKLETFINSKGFDRINNKNKELLLQQLTAMHEYLSILSLRIDENVSLK
ncbi:MAG: hypothetical protein WCR33_06290 [Bacilli bacterium]